MRSWDSHIVLWVYFEIGIIIGWTLGSKVTALRAVFWGFELGGCWFWVGVFCRRSGQCEGDGGVEEVERASLGVGGGAQGGHDGSVVAVAQVVSGEGGQVCEQALVAAGG